MDHKQEAIAKQLQAMMSKLEASKKEKQTAMSSFQKLQGQQRENENVLAELKLMEPDCQVFKMVGPALIPQTLDDSKSTVEKRLEYIKNETKRLELTIDDIGKRQVEEQREFETMRKQLQEMSMKSKQQIYA